MWAVYRLPKLNTTVLQELIETQNLTAINVSEVKVTFTQRELLHQNGHKAHISFHYNEKTELTVKGHSHGSTCPPSNMFHVIHKLYVRTPFSIYMHTRNWKKLKLSWSFPADLSFCVWTLHINLIWQRQIHTEGSLTSLLRSLAN